MGIVAFAVALVAAICAIAWWRLRARRRSGAPRARLLLPPGWEQTLATVPHWPSLPTALQQRLRERVGEFLGTKRFHGCGGLAVTDDMKVAIAGLACLLILRPEARVFPRLRSILVYPTAFWVRHEEPDDLGLVSDEPQEQIGESWAGDRVVLSWEDVAAALDGDAVNVVAHEFAHQLDDENPGFEGAPRLPGYARWSEVMTREYERLQRHRRPPVLDPYGAESPAEFFAVATESYFQRGAELRQHHPELYALLRDYYVLETA